jgi:hypothetical protein
MAHYPLEQPRFQIKTLPTTEISDDLTKEGFGVKSFPTVEDRNGKRRNGFWSAGLRFQIEGARSLTIESDVTSLKR